MDRSKFSHAIIPCKIHSDGRKYPYEITENMWYKWRGVPGKIPPSIVVVPAAYFTDLASVPWAFQWLIKPNGSEAMAAIFHDIACSTELYKVLHANAIFKDAMKDWGVGFFTRNVANSGVFLGCWLTFMFHDKNEVKEDYELMKKASEEVWKEHGHLFSGYARIQLP